MVWLWGVGKKKKLLGLIHVERKVRLLCKEKEILDSSRWKLAWLEVIEMTQLVREHWREPPGISNWIAVIGLEYCLRTVCSKEIVLVNADTADASPPQRGHNSTLPLPLRCWAPGFTYLVPKLSTWRVDICRLLVHAGLLWFLSFFATCVMCQNGCALCCFMLHSCAAVYSKQRYFRWNSNQLNVSAELALSNLDRHFF